MGIFTSTTTPRLRRSVQDLSHYKLMRCDIGYLYPCLVMDCIPGDHMQLSNEVVVRMSPLVAPIMHEITCYVHYYFVPYRILWDQWEDFITGGSDPSVPLVNTLPTLPLNSIGVRTCTGVGGIIDYLYNFVIADWDVLNPISFPLDAYAMIWNEYYRAQDFMPEVTTGTLLADNGSDKGLLRRLKKRDYYTSCLPFQQKGPNLAMNISGTTSAVWSQATGIAVNQWRPGGGGLIGMMNNGVMNYFPGVSGNTEPLTTGYGVAYPHLSVPVGPGEPTVNGPQYLNNNVVDFNSASNLQTFDVNDLRALFAGQLWKEVNARNGTRYREFLLGHYNDYARDERLQRPEYIGGTSSPLIVSEVLQTSNNSTDRGNLGSFSGHGITATTGRVARYRVHEHGLIMGLLNFRPTNLYTQNLNACWTRKSRLEFYFPEFAHLGEQAVYQHELANIFSSDPNVSGYEERIFGYQPRYNEYRWMPNTVHGDFRTISNYWHLGRSFNNHTRLNPDFIYGITESTDFDQGYKRIQAYRPDLMFYVTFGNKIRALRPMPYQAEGGRLDHRT